jgi:hypothetical protein
MLLMASFVVLASAAAAQEPASGASPQWRPGFDFHGTIGWLFLDMGQFDDDLKRVDVGELSFPLAAGLGVGIHAIKGPHDLYVPVTYQQTSAEAHESGRYAGLRLRYSTLAFGYAYDFACHVSPFAELGVSLGNWDYTLEGHDFSGRAQALRYGADGRAGVRFPIGVGSFGLFGGYQVGLGRGARVRSGAISPDRFDDIDLNHASAGVDIRLRFF